MIALLLASIGALKAIQDTLTHHSGVSVFARFEPDGWVRGRWRWKNHADGSPKWYAFVAPFSDLWHFADFMRILLTAAAVYFGGSLLEIGIGLALYAVTFNLLYSRYLLLTVATQRRTFTEAMLGL